MKRNILTIALLLLSALLMPLTACSQVRILTDFPSGQGIEKVYISKSMVNLGLDLADKSLGSYKNSVKNTEGVEVYSCDNPSMIPIIKDKLETLINNYYAEIMIESIDENETSTIYALYNDKDRKNSIGIAIIDDDNRNNEINIVIIHGKVNLNN